MSSYTPINKEMSRVGWGLLFAFYFSFLRFTIKKEQPLPLNIMFAKI